MAQNENNNINDVDQVFDEQSTAEDLSCQQQVDSSVEEIAQTDNNIPSDGDCEQSTVEKRKKTTEKIVNWVLIVAIVLLLGFNLLRIFVVSEVTILQNSMQPTFDPNDKVLVNKLQKASTSDVVVIYKNDVDKFAAYFAPSSEKGSGGKYELLIKRAVAVGGDTIFIEPTATQSGERWTLNIQKNGMTFKEFYVWDVEIDVTEYGQCADCVPGKYVLATDISQALTQGKYALQVTMSQSSLGMLAEYTSDNKYTLADGQLLCLGDNRDRSSDSRQMGFGKTSRLLGVVVKQTHDE